jgi:signal transduction histidine kinase
MFAGISAAMPLRHHSKVEKNTDNGVVDEKALVEAMERMAKGSYEIRLPENTPGENVLLARTFNDMASHISEKINALQRERSGRMRSVFDGEEMERERLSRELHDGIGQSLIAVKLRLEDLLYQEEKDIRNSIQELKRYFDQIIDEVRRISNNLMPSVLELFSIPIAFRNLFTEMEEHSDLKIWFEARRPRQEDQNLYLSADPGGAEQHPQARRGLRGEGLPSAAGRPSLPYYPRQRQRFRAG